MIPHQLNLLRERDRVPAVTPFTDTVIDGYRVVTASSLGMAKSAVVFARVTGSTGNESYVYEIAGPEVMPEEREIVRWAIVEKIA